MENKTCCCFGHREVYQDVMPFLSVIIEHLILHENVTVFMVGGMGMFDAKFSQAVRISKQKYPHISLYLVKPYLTCELNANKAYYESMYDSVIIPDALADVHYKRAIGQRNRWMAEQSNVVVAYIRRILGEHTVRCSMPKSAIKRSLMFFEGNTTK